MKKVLVGVLAITIIYSIFSLNSYAGTPGGDMAAKPDGLAGTYWEASGSEYFYFTSDKNVTKCERKKYVLGKWSQNAENVKITDFQLFDKGVEYTVTAKIDVTNPFGSKDILMNGYTRNEKSKGGAPFRAVCRAGDSVKKRFDDCMSLAQRKN